MYDAAGVGALCRAAGVLYMLDATQSVGQMPIDVQRIGCDFLCGTGRKYLRGSRGSGFLFCRRCPPLRAGLPPSCLHCAESQVCGRQTNTSSLLLCPLLRVQ